MIILRRRALLLCCASAVALAAIVAGSLAGRRTTKMIDGVRYADEWFTEDFTLAELKTLRAKERLPDLRQHNTMYDGRYTIPTFQEVIDIRDELSREVGHKIGLVPELKHSTYFRSHGLPLEEPFVATLRRNHIDHRAAKLTVQSFEVANLTALHRQLPRLPLVQLFDARTSRPGDYIVPRDASGHSLAPTSFIADAHGAGLKVVVYTFRNENAFLPLELRSSANPADYGNAIAEFKQFFSLGVDGVFTDNADTAKAARDDE